MEIEQKKELSKPWRLIVKPQLTAAQSHVSELARLQRRSEIERFQLSTSTFLVRKGTDAMGLSGSVEVINRLPTTRNVVVVPLLQDVINNKKRLATADNNLCRVKTACCK
jgi:hypothetical protein